MDPKPEETTEPAQIEEAKVVETVTETAVVEAVSEAKAATETEPKADSKPVENVTEAGPQNAPEAVPQPIENVTEAETKKIEDVTKADPSKVTDAKPDESAETPGAKGVAETDSLDIQRTNIQKKRLTIDTDNIENVTTADPQPIENATGENATEAKTEESATKAKTEESASEAKIEKSASEAKTEKSATEAKAEKKATEEKGKTSKTTPENKKPADKAGAGKTPEPKAAAVAKKGAKKKKIDLKAKSQEIDKLIKSEIATEERVLEAAAEAMEKKAKAALKTKKGAKKKKIDIDDLIKSEIVVEDTEPEQKVEENASEAKTDENATEAKTEESATEVNAEENAEKTETTVEPKKPKKAGAIPDLKAFGKKGKAKKGTKTAETEKIENATELDAEKDREGEIQHSMTADEEIYIASDQSSSGNVGDEATELYLEGDLEEESVEKVPKKKRYRLKDALKHRMNFNETTRRPVGVSVLTIDVEGGEEEHEGRTTQRSLQSVPSDTSRHTKILDEDYNEILMGEMTDSDLSTSESFETRDPAEIFDSVKLKTHFLDTFDELPDISDISEEEEVEVKHAKKRESAKSEIEHGEADVGVFVDPLTGEVLPESESSTISLFAEEFAKEEEESEQSDEYDQTLLLLPDDAVPVVTTEVPDSDQEEKFRQFQDSLIFIEVEDDEEDMEYKRHIEEVNKIATDFLFDLFDEIVEHVETVGLQTNLAAKLDKIKLIHDLKANVDKYVTEKAFNIALNQKIVDHFKRAKSFRTITEDPDVEVKLRNHARYVEGLQKLDHFKKVAAEAKKVNAYLMSSVLMDLQYVQSISISTEADLVHAMNSVVVRKDSEYLKRLVDHELRAIATLRNQISDTRLFLITRKHTLARLDERIVKFEQITEDLCMTHFISIQNEVQQLDKKLEERIAELKKAHHLYHAEQHIIAHNREKAFLIEHKLSTLKNTLDKDQDTQRNLRKLLFELKVERNTIRKTHKELVYQGGLLAMPTLMSDFDVTVEKVTTKSASVQKLKATMKNLINRIQYVERHSTLVGFDVRQL